MANGLDMDSTGFGFRSGALYRNEGGPGPDGWFWFVGMLAPVGPFRTKGLAVKARDAYLARLAKLDAN
jgi:hypothetical protein